MDLDAGRLVLIIGLAVLPAGLQLWWARTLASNLDDSALPERLLGHRQRRLFACLFAGGALTALQTSAVWWTLPLMVASTMAAAYPLRRAVHDETWSLFGYAAFFLRLAIAVWGFWAAVAVAPAVVGAAGDRAWTAALGVGFVLVAWNLTYAHVLRTLVRARPIPSGPIRDSFEQMVAAAQLPPVILEEVPVKGGVVANAVALPSTAGPAVLVSSTLLERLDAAEVRAILAHELAHIEYYTPRRLWRRGLAVMALALTGAIAAPLAGLVAPDSVWAIRTLWPLVVTVVIVAMAQQQQAQETESDRRAVALGGDAEALMRALEKLHAIGLIPRRWAADHERKASHPSLARRLKDIAAIAGQPPAALPSVETFTAADGRAVVTFHPDRLAWSEGAAAAFSCEYPQLAGVRVHATARLLTLEAVDRAGRRWTMPLASEDVARLQATLDRIDARLSGPSSDATLPVEPALARVAAVLSATVAAGGGFLSVALVTLAAAVTPSAVRLWAATAAGAAASALCWLWPTLLSSDAAWVRLALPLASAVTAAAAWANRRQAPLVAEPRLTAAYALLSVLVAVLTFAPNANVFAMRSALLALPSAIVFPVATAAMLAAVSPRRLGLAAAAVLAVVSAAFAAVGTRAYVDRFTADAFIARGFAVSAVDAPDSPAPAPLWTITELPGIEDLWVAPSGGSVAFHARDEDGEEIVTVHGRSGVLQRLRGAQAAYVDDARLALVVPTDGASMVRVIDIESGREQWRVPLPIVPSALDVDSAGRWSVLGVSVDGDLVFATGTADAAPLVRRWSGRRESSLLAPVLADGNGVLARAQRYDLDFGAHWLWTAFASATRGVSARTSLWRVAETSSEAVRSDSDVECLPTPGSTSAVCAAFDGVDTHLSSVALSGALAVRRRLQGEVHLYSTNRRYVRGWLDGAPLVIDSASFTMLRAPSSPEHRPFVVAASDGALASLGTGSAGTTLRIYAR